MARFIDRRLNPKDKSLGNRQRFMRRARAQIKEVVNKSIKDRNVTDIDSGGNVKIPTKTILEPRFQHAVTGGHRERVLSGNKEFGVGDRIAKPPKGGEGRGGRQGSDKGEGEDQFEFALSRDEFLDLFFEDLELPDLIKTSLKEVYTYRPRRAGFTTSGTPANINVLRTMRTSYGRRLALKRPALDEVEAIEERIREIEENGDKTAGDLDTLATLRFELETILKKRRAVPYLDPMDIRYNNYELRPEPSTNAVMFCLMDVSGSMGEREKDLAKRFFILLHLFLKRRYKHIDIVFIRHTHEAQEVDEQAFFYSRETGGTVVSTALAEMKKILGARYPSDEWNIYAAQASDGDNYGGDSKNCFTLLNDELMPLCQYYAYIEILDEREMEIFRDTSEGAALWRSYRAVAENWPNFAMKRIAKPGDIYPVFRELFARQGND
ncbi:MAG: YeaH/YhbH family protein [Alphaproteobacteria bacterium]